MEDDDREEHEVVILGRSFKIKTAEQDFNSEKKTLFATKLWEGAKCMAEFLLTTGQKYVAGKNVIELGAGAGLPSICAHIAGAAFVCCTDYPITSLLDNIADNAESCLGASHLNNFAVRGLKWGEELSLVSSRDSTTLAITTPTTAASAAAPTTITAGAGAGASAGATGDEHLFSPSFNPITPAGLVLESYDVAIAAECLWRHDSHLELLASLTRFVCNGGVAVISFSHHIPGLEAADLHFITLAAERGFTVEESVVMPAKHMWSDRTVDMHVKVLRRTGN